MLPKVTFAHLPTPIDPLPRLTTLLNGPEIFVKRDDQTGLALGGNKTRKLEYLIADALAQGADLVLTTGAAQSNHCRQTAAAAARCGLDCTLVLVKPTPNKPSGNLFLDQLLGAELVWTEKKYRDEVLRQTSSEAAAQGRKPYLVPYGGSNAVGAFAYFMAVEELLEQLPEGLPDWIVFASSSGGTQAGLVSGVQYHQLKTKILGISIDESEKILKARVCQLAKEVCKILENPIEIDQEQILVNDNFLGEGYGILNDMDREAVQIFAKEEGILLDPVYTGRAGAGLIDLIRSGFFKEGEKVLFWHTGGAPALFAEKYINHLAIP
ncbi:MAG: D-cysteine desulfhydrase family protein [Anaerolineales bacterium]|nr:D-cysteine desulfhydrase family protein [Anaerolineales bacterium]